MKQVLLFLLLLFMAVPVTAAEGDVGFWNEWWGHVKSTAKSRDFELHVPINIWHNRLTYDRENIQRYNERPWGIGFGNYYIDKYRNQHSFAAVIFKDSHNDWESIIGYSWQKNWYFGECGNFVVGGGYLFGVTMRSDYNYVPIPAPLPLLSLEYKRLSFVSTYIPGVKRNSGNVLFTWLRWKF